jgi:hypothetical protein
MSLAFADLDRDCVSSMTEQSIMREQASRRCPLGVTTDGVEPAASSTKLKTRQ